ncbi:MAG: hypothetical protein AAF752_13200 [Bacteroidota bacterium]
MKRKLFTICAALLLMLGLSSTATAQIAVGGHAGLNVDAEEIYIGANAMFELPIDLGGSVLVGNPSIDFYPFLGGDGGEFDIDQSLLVINLDALYRLTLDFGDPYVGAGLGIARASAEAFGVSASDTEIGINIKAGSLFGDTDASFRPFGEVGISLGGTETLFIRGGAVFNIGG